MPTKTTTRRSFTDEFKREAVSLLASSGRPLTQVAAELGIQASMLRSWRGAANGVAKSGADTPVGHVAAAVSAEQAEIRRLRRDLERAQTERDILKRMARPVRKRLVRADLTGLRQRIRSRGNCPSQDGGPRVPALIKVTASTMRHL
jgi:transposase